MADYSKVIEKLFDGQNLTQAESFSVFNQVMHGELSEVKLATLLTALKINGESPNEIAGAASAMVSNARPFPTPDYEFGDIVGTGGDGHHTINISSAAALVAASCGVKVAKHGNRSVSSKSGSADFFRECGIKLDITPEVARKCLDEVNFCFLFAPVYHAGMRFAAPVRAEMKTRTLFNILGPLANPAGPTFGVYGVYTPELLDTYAQTLTLMGQRKALIVHGDGLDELSLHGPTQVVEIDHGSTTHYTVTAADFGLSHAPISAIAGGEPVENRQLIEAALRGEGEQAHREAIAMNAGALLKISGHANTFKDGAEQALNAMATAAPINLIRQVAEHSQLEENA
ncbi:anthranilate phosphoribosyltransferase [Alteromonas oceani]|uniref:Anthranilate phosphoribosyltransferase n=1 Tax=Alteromonas oceani TaxID=2071609 RepID=A0ABV7JSP6_9ALTE|nr:anthranilate phosphoribosyltransferase [Alteromonas oceani]